MTAFTFVTVRGYAVPYGKTVLLRDGAFERFAPEAFEELLAQRSPKIELRWGAHDDRAPVLATSSKRSMELFSDSYGLGFFATLDMRNDGLFRRSDNWWRLRAMTQVRAPTDQCSIGGLVIKTERTDRHLGAVRRTVTKANIDHVTICHDAVYGKTTAVWCADVALDLAPWHIRELADQWDQGFRIHRARQRRERQAATAATYQEIRSRWAANAFGNRRSTIDALHHPAFSSAHGFDGDYAGLIRGAAGRVVTDQQRATALRAVS